MLKPTVKVGRNAAELGPSGSEKLSEIVPGSHCSRNAVLRSLLLNKSNPVQYFHCSVCISGFPDQVVVEA